MKHTIKKLFFATNYEIWEENLVYAHPFIGQLPEVRYVQPLSTDYSYKEYGT